MIQLPDEGEGEKGVGKDVGARVVLEG